MAATVIIEERNGTTPGVATLDPSSLSMGSDDSSELVPATYPITAQADGHAFEKWIRLQLSALGGSSIIDNVKIWLSSIGSWKTGEGMSTNLVTTGYTAVTYPAGGPVDTDSTDATVAMPEAEPAGANLGIAGSLSGQLTSAPTYTDFAVFQLDVTASTPAGSVDQKTMTFQWDEQ